MVGPRNNPLGPQEPCHSHGAPLKKMPLSWWQEIMGMPCSLLIFTNKDNAWHTRTHLTPQPLRVQSTASPARRVVERGGGARAPAAAHAGALPPKTGAARWRNGQRGENVMVHARERGGGGCAAAALERVGLPAYSGITGERGSAGTGQPVFIWLAGLVVPARLWKGRIPIFPKRRWATPAPCHMNTNWPAPAKPRPTGDSGDSDGRPRAAAYHGRPQGAGGFRRGPGSAAGHRGAGGAARGAAAPAQREQCQNQRGAAPAAPRGLARGSQRYTAVRCEDSPNMLAWRPDLKGCLYVPPPCASNHPQ
eukprot:gene10337-biopygen12306